MTVGELGQMQRQNQEQLQSQVLRLALRASLRMTVYFLAADRFLGVGL